MLITDHQGDTIKTQWDTASSWRLSKTRKTASVGEAVEKLAYRSLLVGMETSVPWYSHCENNTVILPKKS